MVIAEMEKTLVHLLPVLEMSVERKRAWFLLRLFCENARNVRFALLHVATLFRCTDMLSKISQQSHLSRPSHEL